MIARAVSIAIASFACLRGASAQSAAAQAETLFHEAKDLMAAGKTAEACAAFDASEKLDPTLSTMLNQANCREKNGQLATAWGLFIEAERSARAATDDTTRKLHQVALDHAHKLEQRVSKLTINVPVESRVDHLEILRDRDAVDPAVWNRALPIDGGTYKITARAPGLAPWTSTITIGVEGDRKSVDVPKLAHASEPAPPTNAAQASPPPTVATAEEHVETPPETPPARHGNKTLAIGLGIGAVAALGGALGLELWGESIYVQSKVEPDPMKQDNLWQSANDRRYAAEGLAIAGVACAGIAVWLYLHDRHATAATARVVPTIQHNGLGIAGQF